MSVTREQLTHNLRASAPGPSGSWLTACLQVRPDLDAQAAADQYTGFSERVSQEDLEEALGYFEYAVAAYYVQVNMPEI